MAKALPMAANAGGNTVLSSPWIRAQAGLKAHKRGLGVKVMHVDVTARCNPLHQAHVECSLGGGNTAPFIAMMSTMRPGTSNGATAGVS
jgi:hypothetical protein